VIDHVRYFSKLLITGTNPEDRASTVHEKTDGAIEDYFDDTMFDFAAYSREKFNYMLKEGDQ
jgi:hypothetical protein